MSVSLQRRIIRLERLVALETPPPERSELTAEQWLTLFQEWEGEGYFATEPDFATALACYRQALEEAAHGSPPFYPSPEFRPELSIIDRVLAWRRFRRYPKVEAARTWLSEFIYRVDNGIPPLTESEFKELSDWFNANEERLRQQFSELLPLSDGRKESYANIRCWLRLGPREFGASKVAQTVRELKTLYGDPGNGTIPSSSIVSSNGHD
jgi:hypothetical protein